MILDKLFLQYADGKKLTFGSKFMSWCGRFFIGTLDENGIDQVRDDLKRSYFYIQSDRIPPTNDKEAMEQWKLESKLLAQYREITRPAIAKGSFYFALALVGILIAVGGSIRLGSDGIKKIEEWWQTKTTADATSSAGPRGSVSTPAASAASEDERVCLDYIAKVDGGQILAVGNSDATYTRCKQLLNQGGK